ncbi:unnamed protein product [Zymoseptoria tritici ST99CH_1A5]|uniref:Uncharacterized protein n=1 Tax=Zymoseptoria tritici ST99CH_1A5 TaxID=1276529 RepID=A0A1Y6M2F5_ZYMTR|nr:unnamed protein product [Zymoseptoria tritici ST99CH_3D1]SMY30069.1 unnamed protein product [Zymoseptoria tritici ST99CH_1A5]
MSSGAISNSALHHDSRTRPAPCATVLAAHSTRNRHLRLHGGRPKGKHTDEDFCVLNFQTLMSDGDIPFSDKHALIRAQTFLDSGTRTTASAFIRPWIPRFPPRCLRNPSSDRATPTTLTSAEVLHPEQRCRYKDKALTSY